MKKICFVFLLMVTLSCSASDKKDLTQIQSQIQTVQQDIKKQQNTRTQLQKNLQQAESELGQLSLRQQQTTAQQKTQQASLQTLNQQQEELQQELATQQQELAKQVRLAYMLGQQEYLKLLLSAEDPSQISRNLTYYQYIANEQLSIITQVNNSLQQLQQNKQAIEQHATELRTLQNQQKQQLTDIKIKHAQREASLQKINTMIRSKDEQLQQLQADKVALDQAVQKVAAAATHTSVGGNIAWPGGGSFAKAKGKMSWPTRGKIITAFNTPIEHSELKFNGVLLAAPEGQNVYAIAPGRVAFADWMSGYGLLMIIEHGDGYMTLYGRNGALYKKVGDQVKPGERIATVGKTGGYSQPSLYFAIRKQAEPLDPQGWCR